MDSSGDSGRIESCLYHLRLTEAEDHTWSLGQLSVLCRKCETYKNENELKTMLIFCLHKIIHLTVCNLVS